ncbi:Vacuolar protein sorting-associated protein 53 [Exophiala dermatitidis]|uniref:Vacuolar protein sorting-associated protein 53 n=1 Tax=Exophiala dermatitidis TaxID=5970 RepID=A0AAN6F1J2_EXODE|nr:Vacuolar protein sorting-associated protein 53 [Exophiala dermatitidis]KAJ4526914.1 Vacuolar protein sorting-associated protein 53 [Exophiala dermatitidis]KAJ4546861.1 Vacuolar protein sorting-associated protein 53 [Exophiala dermatitidis]KAJ4577026.1 Vacuolar protein sorting-associated protein 53 [Exophiala dermatitidis]KAJ4583974.1 Vacuolar protein sorting-associated protein 53 [Exophiala dermatitidis]
MPVNGVHQEVDLLDSDNYDPLEHLDLIFSHPSTLSSVGQTYEALQAYQDDLDDEIEALEDEQIRSNAECLERMEAAKAELADLFQRIEHVRERALQTERNITEMTADIKQLDNTKKNLTLSMTALKRLQMLTTAYEQLRALIKPRQYRECAQLLQAVIQLMAYFKSYRSIDQIATLSRNVADLQRELLEQVCEDFEITFTKEEVPQKRGLLHEACLVVDALGDSARSRLITWYCNTQLRQYRHIFKGDQEAGSLDNIDRRYAWFKKTLKIYDEEHAAIFPPHWRVNEILANVFAEGTRDDFKGILSRSTRNGQTIDVKLLVSCLQQTLDFEHGLERRFNQTSRTSIDTTASANDAQVFGQPISSAFEPYLSLWVEAQDKELATLIPQYKQRPARLPDEEFSSQQVIVSSTELFNFYRHALAQCAKLSTGQPLLDLSRVFGRYLDQYAQQVLLFYISEKPSGGTPSRIPTVEDMILVLNTADYCFNTCNSLEEKIKSRIDENLKDNVDLQSQADAFMGIASAAVRGLVRRVEVDLEPSWREMRNMAWSKIESCENQSAYITGLESRIKDKSGEILGMLHKQQYARAFADNLVELLASTYISNVAQCKPISEGGAEQMLLDTHEIRNTLSHILPGTPPTLFLKRVAAAFNKIEPLLKTLQVRPSPPEALVQAYLIHIADLSEVNFRKILELKGIRGKTEQSHLVELFQMHKFSPRYKDSLVEKSPLLTSLNLSGSTSTSGGNMANSSPATALHNLSALGNSAAASLSTANLPANMKFDASGLGNAIIDRFSSPSLGGIGTPREGALSPPPASGGAAGGAMVGDGTSSAGSGEAGAKLNENLRNIGKFFKRDLGGFGGIGRFGSNKTASSAPSEEKMNGR